MKRKKMLYRGIRMATLKSYRKNGIPASSNFTTNYFTAKNHSMNGGVIAIPLSESNFKITDDKKTFKGLRIGERYYQNKKRIIRFKEVIGV